MNFIDLQAQYKKYKTEIDSAINQVLQTSQYIMGETIHSLEKDLAAYLGAKHAIACSSGTDALLASLMAIDIKPGDEVITTPFTFFATAEVISFMGAVPVFVDIDEKTYNIDVKKIEKAITKKTKAIIPVGLFGQPPDMDEIMALANKHQVVVIEDAAQTLGAKYHNKKSGALAHINCTSFFPAKPMGCYGDGGAVFTDNDQWAKKIRSLLNHGQTERYVHEHIGINGRLDAIQAAILRVKLKYYDEEITIRQTIAEKYNKGLAKQVITPYIKPDRTSIYAQYCIRVNNRSNLIKLLEKNSIPYAIHYPIPLHLQKVYHHLDYQTGDFPISEKIAKDIIALPMSAYLTEENQQKIIKVICKE